MRDQSKISPENYLFQSAGVEMVNGRRTYVLDLEPRRRADIDRPGRIWVTQKITLSSSRGQAGQKSFRSGTRACTLSTSIKDGRFWFPVSNRSETDARIFGQSDLMIGILRLRREIHRRYRCCPLARPESEEECHLSRRRPALFVFCWQRPAASTNEGNRDRSSRHPRPELFAVVDANEFLGYGAMRRGVEASALSLMGIRLSAQALDTSQYLSRAVEPMKIRLLGNTDSVAVATLADTGVYWFASDCLEFSDASRRLLLLSHTRGGSIALAILSAVFVAGLALIARTKTSAPPLIRR